MLTLRPLAAEDWVAVHSWGSRPEFCRYQERSRAFVRAAIEDWSRTPRDRRVYLACQDGRPVGVGELKIRSRGHCQGEITYGVHPDLWGRGLGVAIGRELLAIGFEQLGLHRIYGTCDPRNLGSARVLRKLGMTYEGRLRHTMVVRDGWRDSEMFSILDEEWAGAA